MDHQVVFATPYQGSEGPRLYDLGFYERMGAQIEQQGRKVLIPHRDISDSSLEEPWDLMQDAIRKSRLVVAHLTESTFVGAVIERAAKEGKKFVAFADPKDFPRYRTASDYLRPLVFRTIAYQGKTEAIVAVSRAVEDFFLR